MFYFTRNRVNEIEHGCMKMQIPFLISFPADEISKSSWLVLADSVSARDMLHCQTNSAPSELTVYV